MKFDTGGVFEQLQRKMKHIGGLAHPLHLFYVFTNLKSKDNNKANAPE
jgi:hypothetical protein